MSDDSNQLSEIDLTELEPAELGCELIMSLISPILFEILDGDTPTGSIEQVYAGMIGAMYGEMVSRFGYAHAAALLTKSLDAFQAIPQELFSGKKGH